MHVEWFGDELNENVNPALCKLFSAIVKQRKTFEKKGGREEGKLLINLHFYYAKFKLCLLPSSLSSADII